MSQYHKDTLQLDPRTPVTDTVLPVCIEISVYEK